MARTLKRLNIYNDVRWTPAGLTSSVMPPRRLDEVVRNAYFSDYITRYEDFVQIARSNTTAYVRP